MNRQQKQGERAQAAIDSDPYASGVLHVLASDFPDLRDPEVAAIIRKAIWTHAHAPGHVGIQIIVDNPVNANWKLVPDKVNPGRVRLRCWKQNPIPAAAQERQDRLNEALQALGQETQR